MASTEDTLRLAGKHLLRNYKQPDVVMVRGEGCRLFDSEGRQYLDLYAGIAVCALGHAHPAVAGALAARDLGGGRVSLVAQSGRRVLVAERVPTAVAAALVRAVLSL